MMRSLREEDIIMNGAAYPALHFPEMYLLEGGYKAFHEYCKLINNGDLCEPHAYRMMLDPDFREEMKLFRSEKQSSKPSRRKPLGKKLF